MEHPSFFPVMEALARGIPSESAAMAPARTSEPTRAATPTWLDPRLLIQVVTIIVTMTAGWVTLGSRLDVLQEKLSAIQDQLPNREVLDLKLKALEEEQARLARVIETQDAWIRNTRERLAEKGWKP